jgi:hypothetical protein
MTNAALSALREMSEIPRYEVRHAGGGGTTGSPRSFVVRKYVGPRPFKSPWIQAAGPFGSFEAAAEAASVLRSRP